jgi:hypothetical protein
LTDLRIEFEIARVLVRPGEAPDGTDAREEPDHVMTPTPRIVKRRR